MSPDSQPQLTEQQSTYVDVEDQPWQQTRWPGIEIKILMEDKATGKPFEKGAPKLKKLVQELENRGMLTRTEPYLYLAPPLTLTREEADEIVSIIDESLTVVEQEA